MKHPFAFLFLLASFWPSVAMSQIQLSSTQHESHSLPASISYVHPEGEKGWYLRGLNTENDAAYDLRHYHALRFQMKTDGRKPVSIRCTLYRAHQKGRHNLLDSTVAVVNAMGGNWHEVVIPLASFDYNRGQEYFLKFIDRVKLDAEYADHSRGKITIRDAQLSRAHTLQMETDVYSRPLDSHHRASYNVRITNTSRTAQPIALSIKKQGWEGMQASLSAQSLMLAPGESQTVTVSVTGTDYLPAGAHEATVVQAQPLSSDGKAEEISLISVVPVKSPFIVHTADEWAEVKKNIERYDWAKQEFDHFVSVAENFKVPEVRKGTMSDQGTEGLVRAYIETPLHQTAIAYYLTGNRAYGEKVAETLRRLTDPEMGYPRTQHLTFQGIPQEGGTMEGLLMAYDLLKNSGLLSATDCQNIETTFRMYCHNIIDMMGDGGISNWSVFNLAPAAECALMLHDMDLFNKLAYGPCGLIDQLRYATMDDGWWYEMSLSYNIGSAVCYTATALTARRFGIDWVNQKFPASLTRNVGLRPFEYENLMGMSFGKFGPLRQNTIDIKRMWDGIVAYPDYRGVMFGMGDGHEQRLSGDQFELAYYAFRDPAFASIIKRSPKRSLIYGVGQLPDSVPDLASQSACSDNAGIAVLRSQTAGRPQSQQIQVAVKYGTHGSYHGHFDRISLLSLMRYGRSFYSPETSWFGYGSYMYKWWVQPSMSHNMVVVDGLMQEPSSCDQLLFHTGQMMQTHVMATTTRWSNPPYMGGYDQIERIRKGTAPYVPIPANHPRIEDIGSYSEPVHQRRLTIVTDDYVVLADYLKADHPHNFDNLLQLRGVGQPEGATLKGHRPQWDANPLSSGQFITNVNTYRYADGARLPSVHRFAPQGADGRNKEMNNWETGGQNRLYNTEGNLHFDTYVAWPRQGELSLGSYAESWGIEKQVDYAIEADGQQLAQGCFGAWILGSDTISVPLQGKKSMQITIKTNRRQDRRKTLMLANAYVVTASGQRIPLSSLSAECHNVAPVAAPGLDYEGGPVTIAGTRYDEVVGIDPETSSAEDTLTYNLEGIDAVRLEAILGGDYPVGNEEQLRKTVDVRQNGTEARFVTVLEPHEGHSMVSGVRAESPTEIVVTLIDGRQQRITIAGFYSTGQDVKVQITELRDGKVVRQEETDGCSVKQIQ